MMKSMTGYAKRQCTVNGKTIIVEIKTLNSKQIDASVKIPATYRHHELDIRAMLNRLERGKVDFILTEEATAAEQSSLNTALADSLFAQAMSYAPDRSGITPDRIMFAILNRNEVWAPLSGEEIDDTTWQQLSAVITDAINEVDHFRTDEGIVLQRDFVKHLDLIESLLHQIPTFESQRIDTAKERIRKYLNELPSKNIDENRFEQELIYYLEKLDITEEKVRLQKHLDFFRSTMNNEESAGKKLGFIAQEMGREINTIGSKANQVDIQRIVVQMKDELEKIKEQLGNIL